MANTLKPEEISDIYKIMVKNLKMAFDNCGLAYEMDFYGIKEGYTTDDFLVAYKEGEPCPVCSTIIEKIKTGSTSSYICPQCQKL